MSYDKFIFATITTVVLCLASLAVFLHVFGFLAGLFAVFGESLVPGVALLVLIMWPLTSLARKAGRYIEECWWQVEKAGGVPHAHYLRAQLMMTLGLVLCALLSVSAIFVFYGETLAKLLLYLCALGVSVFLILWPCARLRR